MPNEKALVCRCGIAVDASKQRNGILPSRKPRRPGTKNSKHEKRLNHTRRTRSADRAESHYTYIDSGSSIVSGGIRENAIPEAIYTTIPDDTYTSIDETGNSSSGAQRRAQAVYAVPSMTSPPPTYDMAIAEAWQSGLPPTYEECLCHKHATLSRSHTPPPPWSESPGTARASNLQTRRELLASQPELRELLLQLSSQNSERLHHGQSRQGTASLRDSSRCANAAQQALWEQHVRAQQRGRQVPSRSQSETRAQQQRLAKMNEDAAFCMEMTALQPVIEYGFDICNLM